MFNNFNIIPTFQTQNPVLPKWYSKIVSTKPKVLIIAGPTAAGKTELSLSLCAELNGEVISADSVQIYKDLDLGTDKIDAATRLRFPHHLIDIIPFTNSDFSVHTFYDLARAAIHDITRRGKTPIVVGGNGFFLRWLLYGAPKADVPRDLGKRGSIEAEIRAFVASRVSTESDDVIWKALVSHMARDFPASSGAYASLDTVNLNDVNRLVRRLEILHAQNGEIQPYLMPQLNECMDLEFDFRCIFLNSPRMWGNRRIDYRCETFVARGLLDEVQQLLDRGLLRGSNAASAIGYRQSIDYLEKGDFSDKCFLKFLENLMSTSRRYSKRQRTWFRSEPIYEFVPIPVTELPPVAPASISVLRTPPDIKRALHKRIVSTFNMTHADYWGWRMSETCLISALTCLQIGPQRKAQEKSQIADSNIELSRLYIPQYLVYRDFDKTSDAAQMVTPRVQKTIQAVELIKNIS